MGVLQGQSRAKSVDLLQSNTSKVAGNVGDNINKLGTHAVHSGGDMASSAFRMDGGFDFSPDGGEAAMGNFVANATLGASREVASRAEAAPKSVVKHGRRTGRIVKSAYRKANGIKKPASARQGALRFAPERVKRFVEGTRTIRGHVKGLEARRASAKHSVGNVKHATRKAVRRGTRISTKISKKAVKSYGMKSTKLAGKGMLHTLGSAARAIRAQIALLSAIGNTVIMPAVMVVGALLFGFVLVTSIFTANAAVAINQQSGGGTGEELAKVAYAEYESGKDDGTYHAGGKKYWSFMGEGGRVPWCACFVSYCADQCGYIDDGTMPKSELALDFAQKDLYKNGVDVHNIWDICAGKDSYLPQPGDIVVRGNLETNDSGHVGIVYEFGDDKHLITVEGNHGDKVDKVDKGKLNGCNFNYVIHPSWPDSAGEEGYSDSGVGPVEYDAKAKWKDKTVRNTSYGVGLEHDPYGGSIAGASFKCDEKTWGFAWLEANPTFKKYPYGTIIEVAQTKKIKGKIRAARVMLVDCGKGAPNAQMDFQCAAFNYLSNHDKVSISKLKYRVISKGKGYNSFKYKDLMASSSTKNAANTELDITQDTHKKFVHGNKSKKQTKYIVLHDTEMKGSPKAVISSWLSGGSIAAHFVVGKDGSIRQAVPLDKIAHHAGGGDNGHNKKYGIKETKRDDRKGAKTYPGMRDYAMNAWSIGIEMEHKGKEKYTKAQLEAVDKLIAYIDNWCGSKPKIIDHKAWRSGNSDTSAAFSKYLKNYKSKRTHA